MTGPRRTRAKAGRPPSPDPRRVGAFVRLTADEAAVIDAELRVGESRAAFIRGAAIEKAAKRRGSRGGK